MQVKKYRAATTRAALEQIKSELGDDAFVLETKRVHKRSFLGLRSEPQIEISAVPAPAFLEGFEPDAKVKVYPKVNLREETLAVPEAPKFLDPAKLASYAAPASPKKVIEAVELSSEAPRIIHPKKEPQKKAGLQRPALNIAEPLSAAPDVLPAVSNRDLDLLKSELRELKFSLGTLASRQFINYNPLMADPEEYSEIYDSPYYESFLELTSNGIPGKLAKSMMERILPDHKDGKASNAGLTRIALLQWLRAELKCESDPFSNGKTTRMALIGATGVGKTTTIAKLAARIALQEGRKVELITLDTYRIAAVEQLKTYAEIIGAGCHVVNSTLELDALLHRLPEEAAVLIDTTGRSPLDLADQYDLCSFLQRRADIRKCLAIQATINTADGLHALRKFRMYGADSLAITKLDESAAPGAILEILAGCEIPMLYFGVGQLVPEDLQVASAENFASRILGEYEFRKMAAKGGN